MDRLGRDAKVAADIAVQEERLYLDTADWRLYEAGLSLEFDGGDTLTLRDARTEEVRASARMAEAPTRAGDLPSGRPWDGLVPVLEGRYLLVQLRAQVQTQRLAVLNRDDKTICRLQMARYRVPQAGLVPQAGSRPRVLRYAAAVPVRGYVRAAAQVVAALRAIGLREEAEPLLVSLLSATGRGAPGAELGPGVALRRDEPAARAFAAVLGRLRSHVIANEQGVRDQLDIEFLHDLRVAVRRARSIVRQAAGILPEDQVAALASELGWLGSVTSGPRDLDVHIEEMGERTEVEIEPLVSYLGLRREGAQAELVAALDSERYKKLLDLWRTVATASPAPAQPEGRRPGGEVADEHVARALRRVLKRGGAIDAASAPEALHDLRKRTKELRYLLECFQSLYPDAARIVVVKELKLLQDNLGEYQDCQVQAAALRTMADDLMEDRAAPAATLMALGRLAEGLEARELRARAEFDDRFARFSSRENEKRYAELVGRSVKARL